MKIITVLILWAISLAVAFYAGSRVGVREHYLADSQYQAAITAGNLRIIERNQIETLKTSEEIQLDGDLATYGAYLDSRWKWLWPELQPETPRAIKSAVEYRASHPFDEPALGDPKNLAPGVSTNDPFVLEIVEGQKRNQAQIERVVRMYTKP